MTADTITDVAAAFRDALPPGLRRQMHDTQRAAALTAKAVENGWTIPQLVQECTRDLGGVNNPGAVIDHRLANCARIVHQAKPSRPPHCGACDPATRHQLDGNGLPSPARCSRCHPLAKGA